MDKIELRLTEAQVNQILHILSLRPFNEVFQLIANIQKQAAVQLEVRSRDREHRMGPSAPVPIERQA